MAVTSEVLTGKDESTTPVKGSTNVTRLLLTRLTSSRSMVELYPIPRRLTKPVSMVRFRVRFESSTWISPEKDSVT